MNRLSNRLLSVLTTTLLWSALAVPNAGAQISLDANLLDFGTCTGDTILRTFVITNIGAAGVNVTLSDPEQPFFLLDQEAELSLGLLETHTVTVGYDGYSEANTTLLDTSEITVAYETTGLGSVSGSLTLGLRASCPENNNSGSANDSISFSGVTLDLGSIIIGGSGSGSLIIENEASLDAEVNVGGVDLPFEIAAGGGTSTLASGSTLQVDVSFDPIAEGTFTDSLIVVYNVGDENPDTSYIEVVGVAMVDTTGASLEVLSVNRTTLDFGPQTIGVPSSRTLILTNNDTSEAMIHVSGSVMTFGGSPFLVSGTTDTFDLAPGESEDIIVQFIPTIEGVVADSLYIDYVTSQGQTALDTGRIVVDLRGEGSASTGGIVELTLSDSEVLFNDGDSIEVGLSASETIVITNSGDLPTTINVVVPGAPFTIDGVTGGTVLMPGDSLALPIVFAPTTSGAFSDTLMITYTDGEELGTADVVLRGYASQGISGVWESTRSRELDLVELHPNPVTGESIVSFNLERGGHTTVVLYNELGQQVAILSDREFKPGYHSLRLDGTGLASGLYHLTVHSGESLMSLPVSVSR